MLLACWEGEAPCHVDLGCELVVVQGVPMDVGDLQVAQPALPAHSHMMQASQERHARSIMHGCDTAICAVCLSGRSCPHYSFFMTVSACPPSGWILLPQIVHAILYSTKTSVVEMGLPEQKKGGMMI